MMPVILRAVLTLTLALGLNPSTNGERALETAVCWTSQSRLLEELPDLPLGELPGCPVREAESASLETNLLLPDLRTLPPSDLSIVSGLHGLRELRLSNTIWNSGAGPLELEGHLDPETHKTRVTQHLYTSQPGEIVSRPVGEFIWHKTHDHWHYEQFSVYELWKLDSNGRPDVLISSSDKISYCVIDTDIIDRDNPAFPRYRQYRGCGQGLQGLSPGMGDTYRSFLDGQSITLTGVTDGLYAVISTVNPNRNLLEADYSNNIGATLIEIRGDAIRQFDLGTFIGSLCRAESEWLVDGAPC